MEEPLDIRKMEDPRAGPTGRGSEDCAEDSGFMTPDGNTFYMWFTPDPSVPVQERILDGVTGLYVSQKVNGACQEPQRIWLHKLVNWPWTALPLFRDIPCGLLRPDLLCNGKERIEEKTLV
jgi:hypothetical protein